MYLAILGSQCSQGERLTIVEHGYPRVQLAFIGLGVEVAALDMAEGRLAGWAGLQVAEAYAPALAQAEPALVLGPVGSRQAMLRVLQC